MSGRTSMSAGNPELYVRAGKYWGLWGAALLVMIWATNPIDVWEWVKTNQQMW